MNVKVQLVSRPKEGAEGRSVPVRETLRRIEPLCKIAGITRVADITGLDRVGIPVFSSIRPEAQGGAISVYNGKGLTVDQARVSAIMEGLERYSAEAHGDTLVRKLARSMKEGLDPRELILPPMVPPLLTSRPLDWAQAYDLVADKEVWVPANAVFHPYQAEGALTLFRSNTNGLASGNNLEEAVLHGLCEVVERDAWSLCEVRRSPNHDLIIYEDKLLSPVMDKFQSNGIELHFKDLSSDIGLPVVGVAADDARMQDAGLLTLGIGAHPDPRIAALKAMVEVAQSRLTQIHGAREDTVHAQANRRLGYERLKRMNRMWFEDCGRELNIADMGSLSRDDLKEEIEVLIRHLKDRGLRQVLVYDLTRKELSIPVVRVIVPGMEVHALDPDRAGRRLREAVA